MKITQVLILIAFAFSAVLCRPTTEQVINNVVPKILQKGVDKQVLSAGGYYLHQIIKTSTPTVKLYNLHLQIRGLNNQTRVDLKTTVDDDFNIKSWYYNYSIVKGTRNLGEGMGFAWLNYASSSRSEFCPNIGSYEEAETLTNTNGRPSPRYMPMDNLKKRSSLKDVYDFGLEQHGDFLLPAGDGWLPYDPMLVTVRFEPDYYVMRYGFNQNSIGNWQRTLYLFNVYQPCSGVTYSYARKYDNQDA